MTTNHQSRTHGRKRKRIVLGASAGVLAGLVGLGSFAASTSASAATSSGLAQGAYVGAANPTRLNAFDAATGTHATVATDYLPATGGFAGMDGAGGSLNWLLGAWSGSGVTLSLGVPIIPNTSSGTPAATLAQGATGAYNSYFVTLAQALVAAGDADAYLRLGFEFDGNWNAWYAGTPAAEANFAAYFDQIVTAMRSVAGANFRFVWNPDADAFTASGYNVALAYPGNAYVNVIGLDAYDQSWASPQTPATAWNDTVLPELTAAQQFAAAQGKPLAFTEWGDIIRSDGHGLGDDPLYMTNMLAWMHNPANNVAFETYFDFDASGVNSDLTGGDFPNSLAAFKADIGASAPATAVPVEVLIPMPAPVTTPAPTPTAHVATPAPTPAAPVVTVTPAAATGAPGVVTSLSATVNGNTVTLNWTNPNNAQGDSVYKDGGWIAGPGYGVNPPTPIVQTLTDVNVVVGSHTYAVAAYNGHGQSAKATVTVNIA
jgi:hypothetical protein